MSLTCGCPLGASIENIPIESCLENFGQVQKVLFQRRMNGATLNAMDASTADPKLKASWTALLTSATSTKVVQSPYIQAPAFEAGAARNFGGGNETLDGVEITIGREPTSFTGVLRSQPQKTIKAMKTYECEDAAVALVNGEGKIGLLCDDPTSPTEYYLIPIKNLFISDKMVGGLEAPDSNNISWKFNPNWSDNFVVITPTDFNALTDLATPTPTPTAS